MIPDKSENLAMDRFSRLGSVVVGSVGVVVIVGWVLNIPTLKSAIPGLATMKANSAIAFVVSSVALWLLRAAGRASNSRLWARALALGLVAFAASSLAQDILHLDFGIDQFVMRGAGYR